MAITQAMILECEENGFIVLRDFIPDADLQAMRERIEDIVSGRVAQEGRSFQKLPDAGKSEQSDIPKEAPSLASNSYRKVRDLELDEVFLTFFQNDNVRDLSLQFIGEQVSCMRATLINKPTLNGAELPLHQDVAVEWPMTRPPVINFWFALDDTNRSNGCLEVVSGSHKHGVIGSGHFLSQEEGAAYVSQENIVPIELRAGDAVLFYCSLIHRSGRNQSEAPRRGISLCLMHGDTTHTQTGRTYPILFGDQALIPSEVKNMDIVPTHAS